MLTKNIQRIIRQHQLIVHAKPLVVAASGGADSLALCHLLYHAGYDLHIATLDHGLRGDAGQADADFMCQMARLWGVPCTMGQVDVPALTRKHNTGIEATARKARYDFLADVARQISASTIATAHHADDQAETVLMHILRGSGLQGLRGMAFRAPVPGHTDLTLVRPLLAVTRAEIEAYCREHDLHPRHDTTNDDTDYLRNHIRLEVLPFLKTTQPNITQTLVRLADNAVQDADFIEAQYQKQVEPYIRHVRGRFYLPQEVFTGLHPALQRRFVLNSVTQIAPPESHPGHEHIIAGIALALRGEVGAVAQFPGGVQLRVDYDRLVIEPDDLPPDTEDFLTVPPETHLTVNMAGETVIPGADWHLRVMETPHTGAVRVLIPADGVLTLRTRRPGDRFPGQTRKLKAWMIDQKIPQSLRALIPLLEINGNIIAICLNERKNIMLGRQEIAESVREVYISVNFS